MYLVNCISTIAEALHPSYNKTYKAVSAGRRDVASITAGLCGDPIVVRKSAKSSSNAFGNGIVSRQASAFGKWNAEECTVVPCLLVAV
jgi:hypothetical protein